mmetsp:Transcript_15973/g.42088  ORF Transcript_15973/g.42088 Transcript_15973/m.42088 type:complete len:220 (-) Transcript_15973:864-1523(-)
MYLMGIATHRKETDSTRIVLGRARGAGTQHRPIGPPRQIRRQAPRLNPSELADRLRLRQLADVPDPNEAVVRPRRDTSSIWGELDAAHNSARRVGRGPMRSTRTGVRPQVVVRPALQLPNLHRTISRATSHFPAVRRVATRRRGDLPRSFVSHPDRMVAQQKIAQARLSAQIPDPQRPVHPRRQALHLLVRVPLASCYYCDVPCRPGHIRDIWVASVKG